MTRLWTMCVALLLTMEARPVAACEWRSIDPGGGHFITGSFSASLGDPDQLASPTAWQGPIVITQATGGSCTVDPAVGIIERPLFASATKMLVSTYSGSNTTVFIIDSATCKIAWKSKPFDGHAVVQGNRLDLGGTALTLNTWCPP